MGRERAGGIGAAPELWSLSHRWDEEERILKVEILSLLPFQWRRQGHLSVKDKWESGKELEFPQIAGLAVRVTEKGYWAMLGNHKFVVTSL